MSVDESQSEHGITTQLAKWLELHRNGDPSAKAEIIAHSCERLRVLTSKILRRDFARLARWEQTDDVLQNSLAQLHRSLNELKPESVGQFMGLAATQIRRNLINLVRHHFGPEGAARKHHSDIARTDVPRIIDGVPAKNGEPETLEEWDAFLKAFEKLPEVERTVIELIHLQGMTQVEAAEALGITDRTIRRHLQSAKVLLHEAIGKTSE